MEKRGAVPHGGIADWPQIDRALWENARASGGPFDESGPAADWAPATLKTVVRGYGVWLGWLERTDQLDPGLRPIERVSEDRVRAFLEDYAPGRALLTQAAVIKAIARLVRCTEPPDGLVWLTKTGDRMGNTSVRARPKPPRMATELKQAYARLVLSEVAVSDDAIRITGSKTRLAKAAATDIEDTPWGVLSSVREWRTRKDSNL